MANQDRRETHVRVQQTSVQQGVWVTGGEVRGPIIGVQHNVTGAEAAYDLVQAFRATRRGELRLTDEQRAILDELQGWLLER